MSTTKALTLAGVVAMGVGCGSPGAPASERLPDETVEVDGLVFEAALTDEVGSAVGIQAQVTNRTEADRTLSMYGGTCTMLVRIRALPRGALVYDETDPFECLPIETFIEVPAGEKVMLSQRTIDVADVLAGEPRGEYLFSAVVRLEEKFWEFRAGTITID